MGWAVFSALVLQLPLGTRLRNRYGAHAATLQHEPEISRVLIAATFLRYLLVVISYKLTR